MEEGSQGAELEMGRHREMGTEKDRKRAGRGREKKEKRPAGGL